MSSGWNFADLFEALAERQPDALAQRHAGRSTTWAELDRRADGIASGKMCTSVACQRPAASLMAVVPMNTLSRRSATDFSSRPLMPVMSLSVSPT
jgi:hypothetical protein